MLLEKAERIKTLMQYLPEVYDAQIFNSKLQLVKSTGCLLISAAARR